MKIIDGKAVADKIKDGLRQRLSVLTAAGGRTPCLAAREAHFPRNGALATGILYVLKEPVGAPPMGMT